MKKTLKLLPALLLAMLFGFCCWSCSDGDTEEEITVVDQLPTEAKTFLATYFNDYEVVRVIKNNDNPVWYEVQFRAGGKVKFDAKGRWYEADADNNLPLPNGFYPGAIDGYVLDYYPGFFVTEIDRNASGYEVELNNNVELLFNAQGEFVSVKHY